MPLWITMNRSLMTFVILFMASTVACEGWAADAAHGEQIARAGGACPVTLSVRMKELRPQKRLPSLRSRARPVSIPIVLRSSC